MAIANITKITLSGTLTTLSIANGIRDALISCGYNLFHSYQSGSSEGRVMALQQSSATKGTVFLQYVISSGGTVTYSLNEGWNTSTNVGTNASASSSIAITTGTTNFTIYVINHPEFKGLVLEQGTVQGILGIIRLLKNNLIPSWWNENLFAYAFIPRPNSSATSTRFGSTTTPFGNNIEHEYFNSTKMQDGNSQDSDRRSTLPFFLWQNGNNGALAVSDDIVIGASNTMRLMDTLTISSTEIYTYFWINSTNSGLAIRTT